MQDPSAPVQPVGGPSSDREESYSDDDDDDDESSKSSRFPLPRRHDWLTPPPMTPVSAFMHFEAFAEGQPGRTRDDVIASGDADDAMEWQRRSREVWMATLDPGADVRALLAQRGLNSAGYPMIGSQVSRWAEVRPKFGVDVQLPASPPGNLVDMAQVDQGILDQLRATPPVLPATSPARPPSPSPSPEPSTPERERRAARRRAKRPVRPSTPRREHEDSSPLSEVPPTVPPVQFSYEGSTLELLQRKLKNGYPLDSWARRPDRFFYDRCDEAILGYIPGKGDQREPTLFEVPETKNDVAIRNLCLLLLEKHNVMMMDEKIKRRPDRVKRFAAYLLDARRGRLIRKTDPCTRCVEGGLDCVGRSGGRPRGNASCMGCSVLWYENTSCTAGAAAEESAKQKEESMARFLRIGTFLFSREADQYFGQLPGLADARAAWQSEARARGYSRDAISSPAKKVQVLVDFLNSAPLLSMSLARKRKADDSDEEEGEDETSPNKRGRR